MSAGGLAFWACSPASCFARAVCSFPLPRLGQPFLILFATVVFWTTPVPVRAQTASLCTLNWDANTEPSLAGYKLYHSKTSGVYGAPAQVIGWQTQTTCEQMGISVGDDAAHYFTVTAYTSSGIEGPHSNEVSKYLPAPVAAPTCVRFLPSGRCKK